ncbi:unnamed protein product [Staurois parvus]|uniref:Uncharacterized protein n=1 Tax=Staurois parvus TaxID=386267 RepID=A0ABN9FJB1_9NEOB|nr:unnamed protein product [Staurois parvus]
MWVPVCFLCVLISSSAFCTVLCRKNAGCSTFSSAFGMHSSNCKH